MQIAVVYASRTGNTRRAAELMARHKVGCIPVLDPSTPTGFVPAVVGQTRYFQSWHRDAVGGSAVSNFTNGLRIQF